MASALIFIRKYKLDPRDSIYAAAAVLERAEAVVSTDAHFDNIKEIKRKPL